MPSPFHWQTTLDSGVLLGFTGKSFGSLASPKNKSGVGALTQTNNRERLNRWADQQGYQPVKFMNQTHSCTVIERSAETALPQDGFDGHFSTTSDTSLGVLVADCLPILIHGLSHKKKPVVAAIHAGRVGLLEGIVHRTARLLLPTLDLSQTPVAVIGPAICGGCYEVPEKMREAARSKMPSSGISSTTSWGSAGLNLAAAAEHALQESGFTVIQSGICTLESPDFYSYRGRDQTERNAGIVMVPSP